LRITGLTTPAHEETKEVAQMITNTIKTAVQIPSGFGMPACGHASFRVSALPAGLATTSVVRDRQATAAKGDMGLIAYVPGTSAWRPPSS
jgi:hypothetical protein